MGAHSAPRRRDGRLGTIAGRGAFAAVAALTVAGGGSGVALACEAPPVEHVSHDGHGKQHEDQHDGGQHEGDQHEGDQHEGDQHDGTTPDLGEELPDEETPDLGDVLPELELPGTETPEAEAPETETPEAELPQAELPQAETPEAEAPEAELPETETPEAEAPEELPQLEGDESTTGEGGQAEQPEDVQEAAPAETSGASSLPIMSIF